MSCQLSTTDAENRVFEFTARYALNGPFGASAKFVDFTCEDDIDCYEICDPISLTIDAEVVINNCDDTVIDPTLISCFSETPVWVNGLQRSYSRTGNITSVSISSYYEYLNSKPLSTQAFQAVPLSTAIDTIFRYYAGVNPSLLSINSFSETFIKGPIEGNNTYEELALLAMAGKANLFVQVGGNLTIESWKDHTDPIEFVIPPDLTISADLANFRFPNTTVIKATGAPVSVTDCGEKTLTSQNGLPSVATREVTSGVPKPTSKLTVNGLKGDENDLKSAFFVSDTLQTTNDEKEVSRGGIKQEVEKQDGQFFDNNTTRFNYIYKGRTKSFLGEGIYGQIARSRPFQQFSRNAKTFGNFLSKFLARRFPIPYSLFGLGAFGSLPFIQGQPEQDNATSQNYQQAQLTTVLPISLECGVSTEQIDNKYLFKKEDLFSIAVRRYQEILMSQNTWNVEVAYTPCIKLNQMVQFTVPETQGCPTKTIKGIVAAIDVNHSRDDAGFGETSMRLSILDVSCLGQTEIQSANLIETGCVGNGSTIDPWTTSQINLNQLAQGSAGNVYLFASAGASSFAFYQHDCATVGDEYQLYFEYYTLQGPTSFQFSIGTGAPTTLAGSGAYSTTFNAPASNFSLNWDLAFSPADAYVRITNIILTKKVFA